VSFIKPEYLFYLKLDPAVSVEKAGLCLKLASDGEAELCAAGDRCVGVAFKSTEDPLNPGTYLKGVEVALVREGVVYVQLPSTHSAISPGDRIKTAANGYVDKFTDGDTTTAWPTTYSAATAETITDEIIGVIRESKQIVGLALESKAANTGGKLKVLLTLPVR